MTLAMQAEVLMVQETFQERAEYRQVLDAAKGTREAKSRRTQAQWSSGWQSGQAASAYAGIPHDENFLQQQQQWYGPPGPQQPQHAPPAAALDATMIADAVAKGVSAAIVQTQKPADAEDGDIKVGETEVEDGETPISLSLSQSALALRGAPVSAGFVQIPVQRARLILDTLERADLAMQSFVTAAVEAAGKARHCQGVIDENRNTMRNALRKRKD